MNEILKTVLGSSPKTTIIGILEGCVIACIPIFLKEGFVIKNDWPLLIPACLAVIRGRLTKDSNGITASQAQQVIIPRLEDK